MNLNRIVFAMMLPAVAWLTLSAAGHLLDDTVVCRPNADGAGNSLWIMNRTTAPPVRLDGSADSYLAWGSVGERCLVGDVNGDGLDDVVTVREQAGTGYNLWLAAHTSGSETGVGALSSAVSSNAANGTWSHNAGLFLADVNGDGRDDTVYVGDEGGGFDWWAGHSTEQGVGFAGHSWVGGGGWGGSAYGDTPLVGDFNGDSYADMCVFRAAQGLWIPAFSTADGISKVGWTYAAFGQAGDIPLVGDINGDGRDDGLVVRDDGNGNALWIAGFSSSGGQVGVAGVSYGSLGLITDRFLVADINGDGRDDIGIFREGYWAFGLTGATGQLAANVVDAQQVFGQAGDVPLIGQFDSLPTADLGQWSLLLRIATYWLADCTVADCGAADRNDDDTVNLADLALVASDWVPGPLLVERWEQGDIDADRWTAVNADPARAVLTVVESPVGSGDHALQMASSNWGNWEVSLWSKQAFPRGGRVSCTFDVWHDAADRAPSLLGWYGPWKHAVGTQAWQYHEAAVDHVWSELRWAESGMNQTGPLLDLNTAWAQAYGRSHALKVRVTLGDNSGALLQYSTDGGAHWAEVTASPVGGGDPFAVDTLWRPPFLAWRDIMPGESLLNHVGFGNAGNQDAGLHTYIDNIIVDRDAPVDYDIGYVQPDAPQWSIPPYAGQRYADTVPDTLDLAERAKLAIHALTAPLYAPGDYHLYWLVSFFNNPTRMWFGEYTNITPKFFEALPLVRIMTGSDYNDQVDQTWMDQTCKSIGPQGLYYIATAGKSFILWDPPAPQLITPIALGRITGALANYYHHGGAAYIRTMAENLVLATDASAVQKEDGDRDWCFWPSGVFAPENLPFSPASPVITGWQASELGGRVIQGPAQLYAATGFASALALSRKCTIYMKDHSGYFNPADGGWNGTWGGYPSPHFAMHSKVLDAMTDYAIAAADQEVIDFVKLSYEWARDHPASCKLVGFYPEILDTAYPSAETCELADMLAIGVKLSAAGYADYWDDVDRCLRNQFAENQLLSVDWVGAVEQSFPVTEPETTSGKRGHTTDHVPQRNLGAWAGWSRPNYWGQPGIMHCCTGNAARAMYHVWKHIVEVDGDTLKLNFLLNRAASEVDVYSYVPYEGRVDIRLKHGFDHVTVRLPEWIAAGNPAVMGQVNQQSRSLTWQGRYVDVGPVSAGDLVTVTFPISERTEVRTIGGVSYTFVVRGTTVVQVTPAGPYYPFYQRAHYRTGVTRWRDVERFVYDGG